MPNTPHGPKKRGYQVRVATDHISVEHRESFGWDTAGWAALIYLIMLVGYVLPGRSYATDDPSVEGFVIYSLLVTIVGVVIWLRMASGEVLYCDAHELRFARRRTVGRWHRFRFPAAQVQDLRYEYRSRGRSGYWVLTFKCDGRRHDLLENLNRPDVGPILRACKSMGLSVILPDTTGDVMLADIAKRGWFVNPLKPEHEETTAPKQ